MTNDVFLEKIENAIWEVEKEIDAHRNGNGTISNLSHLNLIKAELIKMKRYLSKNDFTPYYPREIADSWDYSHELAICLTTLATDYYKL